MFLGICGSFMFAKKIKFAHRESAKHKKDWFRKTTSASCHICGSGRSTYLANIIHVNISSPPCFFLVMFGPI
jgi:hypothetical protein